MKNKYGWHVLYVRSRHEEKVYKTLIEKQIEAFLPMVTVVRKWSDRKKKLRIPLFTSYVFVNVQSNMDFYQASELNGACSFIKFGNQYATVKESEINKIKLLVNLDEIEDVQSDFSMPDLGEMMKITYGPLEGLTCKVVRLNDNFKIQVAIESLKQSIYAQVPASYLTPLALA